LEKEKENIKTQFLKKLEYYKNNKGISFLDHPSTRITSVQNLLEKNELEVLVINNSKNEKIVITIMNIFIISSNGIEKIKGNEIAGLDNLNFIDSKPDEQDGLIRKAIKKYKFRKHSGEYKLTKKDNSSLIINFKKTDHAYCFSSAVKILKFITSKYIPV
jgi:hypothetical protein